MSWRRLVFKLSRAVVDHGQKNLILSRNRAMVRGFVRYACLPGCFRHCIGPALRDTTLRTRCTDSRGRPQPLIKCADPSDEFNLVMRNSPWRELLQNWLLKGGAPSACQHLLRLLDEDENARWQQLYLMSNQLDKSKPPVCHMGPTAEQQYQEPWNRSGYLKA